MSETDKKGAARTAADEIASTAMPTGQPGDVAVFPYLVFIEFVSALLASIVLMVWSMAVNAPLLAEATPGVTENPAKAPWYFVGLQELLVYFDPWIAGVAMPTLIIVGLMAIPYLDTTRNAVGRYTLGERRLAIGHFLFGFAMWWVLIIIGQFLRGPNWHLFWPWQEWTVGTGTEQALWSLPLWGGLLMLAAYSAGGVLLMNRLWPRLRRSLDPARYALVIAFLLIFYGVPVKIFLRVAFSIQYVLVTPWFNI